VSGEFKDPLAALLEVMSKIKKGEQVWIQIIIRPTDISWTKRSVREAYKIAGKKAKAERNWLEKIFGPIWNIFFTSTGESIFFSELGGGSSKSDKKDDLPSLMLHLTPGEKGALEAIEEKASKTGFDCKIRLIYIAPHELYQPPRVISPVFGAIKQFNTLDLNAFKPDPKTKTTIMYLFIKLRQAMRRTKLMRAYKTRSGVAGHAYFILNIEELATIWHFPSKLVSTPLLQKTAAKKAEAPTALPIDFAPEEELLLPNPELQRQLNAAIADYDVKLDDKHFEEKFAKDKSQISTNKKGNPPANLPTT